MMRLHLHRGIALAVVLSIGLLPLSVWVFNQYRNVAWAAWPVALVLWFVIWLVVRG